MKPFDDKAETKRIETLQKAIYDRCWKIYKIRVDKGLPNNVNVAEKIEQSIKDNILEDELIKRNDEINEKIYGRRSWKISIVWFIYVVSSIFLCHFYIFSRMKWFFQSFSMNERIKLQGILYSYHLAWIFSHHIKAHDTINPPPVYQEYRQSPNYGTL